MAPPRFRPAEVLRVLMAHDVRFVVIGGLAGLVHGSPFPTGDVDITPDVALDNLQRLSDALGELGARVWFRDGEDPLPFAHDGASLAGNGVWNLVTDFGRVDLLLVPNGTQGFADLVRDATEVSVAGVTVLVASLADVIRSKQAANRPKDQRVLPVLRRILAARYDT